MTQGDGIRGVEPRAGRAIRFLAALGMTRGGRMTRGVDVCGVEPRAGRAIRFLAALGMTRDEAAAEDPGVRGFTSPGAPRHPLQRGTRTMWNKDDALCFTQSKIQNLKSKIPTVPPR